MNIAVVGLGYVGLEVAISFAEEGCLVVGVDTDLNKIAKIAKGLSPVENVGNDRLTKHLDSGDLKISSDFSTLKHCDAVIFCVPTPLNSMGEPELRYLRSALHDSAPFFSENALVVNESTSFPGTLRSFLPKEIAAVNPSIVGTLEFAVAPERVSPGNHVPLRKIPRVASGLTAVARSRVKALYEIVCDEVIVVGSPEIAEMSKLLENTFRQVNISFINEFNIICRKLGIDTRQVIEAANTKPFGFMKFEPGPGIGGHCIPIDPLYLQYSASEVGATSEFIEVASRYNQVHAQRLIELVQASMAPAKLESVLLLGVAYKPDLGDVRETPAKRLLSVLNSKGVRTGWLDPLVQSWDGMTPSTITGGWSAAIIHTPQKDLPIEELLNSGITIFDLTGRYSTDLRIRQL